MLFERLFQALVQFLVTAQEPPQGDKLLLLVPCFVCQMCAN